MSPTEPIPLSDVLPMLENMGLKVLSEVPYAIKLAASEPEAPERTCWLHNFGMQLRDGREVEVPTVRDDFHEVFARVWSGTMENDGFNRLVLRAGPRRAKRTDAAGLCASTCARPASPSARTTWRRRWPRTRHRPRCWSTCSSARFDPAAPSRSRGAEAAIVDEIEAALDEVEQASTRTASCGSTSA